jgi:hypothetical protein
MHQNNNKQMPMKMQQRMLLKRRHKRNAQKMNFSGKHIPLSVTIPITQRPIQGIYNIPDPNIGPNPRHIHVRIQRQRIPINIPAIDIPDPILIHVLPDAIIAIDEGVMQPEHGIPGARVHVGHDGADAVVAPRVRAPLGATRHARVVRVRVARVDDVGVGVGGELAVAVARQAVRPVVTAGADVER